MHITLTPQSVTDSEVICICIKINFTELGVQKVLLPTIKSISLIATAKGLGNYLLIIIPFSTTDLHATQ